MGWKGGACLKHQHRKPAPREEKGGGGSNKSPAEDQKKGGVPGNAGTSPRNIELITLFFRDGERVSGGKKMTLVENTGTSPPRKSFKRGSWQSSSVGGSPALLRLRTVWEEGGG